jgi:hypothetical protein
MTDRYLDDDQFHVDMSDNTPAIIIPVDGPGHVPLQRADLIAMLHALDKAIEVENA